jgi:hypothetical protein
MVQAVKADRVLLTGEKTFLQKVAMNKTEIAKNFSDHLVFFAY